jgi:WD repeat-containing protein mio
MEAAIRWSPHATRDRQRYLIIDVAQNRLELRQRVPRKVRRDGYGIVAQRDRLPNFTAFDWSKTEEAIVAIGAASGEAILLDLSQDDLNNSIVETFPIKHQRKCNSIAFSNDDLLATGLERVRNDFCMNIYDVNQRVRHDGDAQEPYRKLSSSEAITSIKFLPGSSQTLLAGVARQCIRFYDLRDSYNYGAAQFTTRHVHNITVDPLDENYFLSAAPAGEPVVTIWDRRYISRTVPGTPTSDSGVQGAVLELRPAIDHSTTSSNPNTSLNTSIWSLRFSGERRGRFFVLASTGEVKAYEIANNAVDTSYATTSTNPYGGSPWSSRVFIKQTQTIVQPPHNVPSLREDGPPRLMAVDFTTIDGMTSGQGLIALYLDRSVSFLRGLKEPAHTLISAQSDILSIKDQKVSIGRASDSTQSIAHDLAELKGHENRMFPKSDRVGLDEALLRMQIPRRRCLEGYLLDCDKNKDICVDDPTLVEMWDIMARLRRLAQSETMVADTLDLTYLGVNSIWKRNIGKCVNRALTQPESTLAVDESVHQIARIQHWPKFDRMQTQYPYHRQVCLAICGWALTKDDLEEICNTLVEEGKSNKAVVLAIFHGHKDVAARVFRKAVHMKQIADMSLGAILTFDSLNDAQRELCLLMADGASDPYLKALLARLLHGSWAAVVELADLPLVDRIGVALTYFDDGALDSFIESETTRAVRSGCPEGLTLTGLAASSLDLFQNYISRTNDLQTAVIALSFTVPLYLRDTRYKIWMETYHGQLQTWQAFLERSHFSLQRNRLAVLPRKHQELANAGSGRQQPKPRSQVKTPRGQITVRCSYCQKPMAISVVEPAPSPDEPESPPSEPQAPTTATASSNAQNQTGSAITAGRPQQRPHARSRLCRTCKNCGHPFPRCGVCHLWVGAPEPDEPGATDALAKLDLLEGFIMHCLTCMHAFHPRHANSWFAKRNECPVADCRCKCMLRQIGE